MTEEELQKLANDLKNYSVNTKGESFRNHAKYIKYRKGEDGIKKVEDKMAELGVPVKLREIDPNSWHSAGLSTLVIIVACHIFDWGEEDAFEWGRFRTKVSFMVRMITRYIVSINVIITQAEKLWEKIFDSSTMEIELNEDKNKMTIKIKGFKTHPLACHNRSGYFKGMIELCVNSEKGVEVEEVKCVHKGDEYCEHIITW